GLNGQLDEAKREADQKRDEAETAWQESQRSEEKAKRSEEKRHLLQYATDVTLAWAALDQREFLRMRPLLARHKPKQARDPDLRGFEWQYLRRQCHDEELTLGHQSAIVGMALTPDGRFVPVA